MKRYLFLEFLFFVFALTPVTVLADVGSGDSFPDLEYEVVYLDSKGVTTVHETGIDFIPFDPGLPSTFLKDILPEEYIGAYPLYFVEDTLVFEIHITNAGSKSVKNLNITAIHELLDIDGNAGEPFSNGEFNWKIKYLKSGETSILYGSMIIPTGSPNGIDQTHIVITQLQPSVGNDQDDTTGNGELKAHKISRVLIDDPQAGLWCPVERQEIE